jgi:hypothetical protein
MKANNISSKESQKSPLRSLVPIEWEISSKKVIQELFPNFVPFKKLRHPLCILTSNLSSLNVNLLPPSLGAHDHSIALVLGSLTPNVHPYHHPSSQKNEIEKIVQELLDTRVICPSTNLYSSPVVMVLNK